MVAANSTESPLEAATGVAGPWAIEAFELIANETRLAILLALWDAYDPHTQENALSFSELRNRVGSEDSGQFNYHLDKLIGRFVDKTDDGYEARHSALKIVKAIIAGVGFEQQHIPPTEVPRSCDLCGGSVELSYDAGYLYHTCTACDGLVPPGLADELPSGTVLRSDTRPAAVANRDPEEAFIATTVNLFRNTGLVARGNCPECSGRIVASLHRCEAHDPAAEGVCPTCGTRDEFRARFVCSVCKWWKFAAVESAVVDHPAVVAFCHEHGLPTTYDLDDAEDCGRLWEHRNERDHTLVSEEPLRVRVSVPGDGETLLLTLDENLDVIDETRSGAE